MRFSVLGLTPALGLVLVLTVWLVAGPARAAGSPTTAPGASLPCDIDASDGTPCVAAYSTVRRLASDYDGPLYQVTRASDDTTLDISARAWSGVADAGAQRRFCRATVCTVTELYDQSGEGNNLTVARHQPASPAPDLAASAMALPVWVSGQRAYGLDITRGVGYRDDLTHGMAIDGQPESMYMVTSSYGTDHGCCFDFGNAETTHHDDGDGHMDAVNISSRCVRPVPCYGPGPWVQADLENGLFQSNTGDSENPFNPSLREPFVTAMLKNDGQDDFALKNGNAQTGGLTTSYAGRLPDVPGSDYSPMHQEGAIVLGIGGDNSRGGSGEFYEGVITTGLPSDGIDDEVQAEIVAAGYRGTARARCVPAQCRAAVARRGHDVSRAVNPTSFHRERTS